MKILKKKPHTDSDNYWQPAADIMVGLLLIILLIMALLLSYLARRDEKKHNYDEAESRNYYTVEQRPEWVTDEHETETTTRYIREDDDDDNGGGGGGDDGEETTRPEGWGEQDWGKTAVLVSVIDAETGNIIKKSGILFELYADRDARGGLQALHTYYPTKIEYKQYETDKNGRFYLPEKIVNGWYSLHNLKVPEQYEEGGNTNFEIVETRDWDDPYLVSVLLSPVKNIIKLKAVDSVTNDPVAAGVYEIVAAEDIMLLDGTVRLKKGELADTVTCDETGYAESKELYLGKYTIRHKQPSEFYALSDKAIDAEVKNVAETEIKVCRALCDKTEYTYTLTDELTGDPISGAVFVSESGEKLTTDDNGRIVLTDLDKNADYGLQLEELPEPYRPAELSASFKVDARGCISGKAKYEAADTAYAVRMSASVADKLLRQDITGINLTLYNKDGKVVENWDSNGTERVIEGLEPGKYYLEVAGKKSTRATFDIKDESALQDAVIYIWTITDIILIVIGAGLVATAVVITVQIIRKKKKVKNGG